MNKVIKGRLGLEPILECETRKILLKDYLIKKDKKDIFLNGIIYYHLGSNSFAISDWFLADDERSYIQIYDEYVFEVENIIIENTMLSKIFSNISDEINNNKTFKANMKTYLMIDEQNNYYKIGRSNNPNYRESTLQSEKPLIKLLMTCNIDIENELHLKFQKNKR